MPRAVAENETKPPPPGILARIAAVVYPLVALGLIAGGLAWGFSGPLALVAVGVLLWIDFVLTFYLERLGTRARRDEGTSIR